MRPFTAQIHVEVCYKFVTIPSSLVHWMTNKKKTNDVASHKFSNVTRNGMWFWVAHNGLNIFRNLPNVLRLCSRSWLFDILERVDHKQFSEGLRRKLLHLWRILRDLARQQKAVEARWHLKWLKQFVQIFFRQRCLTAIHAQPALLLLHGTSACFLT